MQGPISPDANTQYWIFEDHTPRARGAFLDNRIDGTTPNAAGQWDYVRLTGFDGTEEAAYQGTVPFGGGDYGLAPTQAADIAATSVLLGAGASHNRDALDAKLVQEIENSGGEFINEPSEFGEQGWVEGYPPLDQ